MTNFTDYFKSKDRSIYIIILVAILLFIPKYICAQNLPEKKFFLPSDNLHIIEQEIEKCVFSFRSNQINKINLIIKKNENNDEVTRAINLYAKYYLLSDFKYIDEYFNDYNGIKNCMPVKNNSNKSRNEYLDNPLFMLEFEEKLFVRPEEFKKDYKNYKIALDLLKKSSSMGSDEAKILLGEMHAAGRGVPVDANVALELFLPVARKGNSAAQWDVAQLYRGESSLSLFFIGDAAENSINSDYKLSYMWFNIAAGNGLEKANNARIDVSKKLSIAELEQAQRWSTECIKSNYKNCSDHSKSFEIKWLKFWK